MEILLPVLVIVAICVVAFIAFRTIGTSSRAEEDSTDPVPRLSTDEARPLGDTPEAHDEINPHDLPPDHPGRSKAEEMAEGDEGETEGMESGGAAGEGGSEEREGRHEPVGEAHRGATTD